AAAPRFRIKIQHSKVMESACASPDWVSRGKLKRPAGAANFDGAWSNGQLKKPRIVYNSKRHRDPFNLSADDEKENETDVVESEGEDASASAADVIDVDAETITVAAAIPPKAQKQRKKQKQKQNQKEKRTTSAKWYEVEKIIRQKQSEAKHNGKSETQYLVKWAGKQANSRPWPCSWEEESHISSDVLGDWRVEIQRRKSKPDECESGKPVKPGAQVIGECQYDAGKVSMRLTGGREMMVNWENVRFGDLMAWDGNE
ncbi:hypothetical protein HII31_02735, partial [Pseudocercospora fuligena]